MFKNAGEKLFKNAGEKLKITAKVLFLVIVVFGIIDGIYVTSKAGASGLLIIPISVLAAWVTSLVLYAFGDICENIDLIHSNMYIVASVTEKRFPDLAEEDPADKADDANSDAEQ